MERHDIIQELSKHMSEKRLAHCIRVEETALKLAKKFQVEPELITPAALLHDLCREYHPDLLLKLAINFGIVIDDIERTEPILLHAPVAAAIAEHQLGISHPDILEAISYHVTGAPGVSALTQLIYIADFIEPGRKNPAAESLQAAAGKIHPEQLLLKVYHFTLNYLIKHNYLIHPRGIAGRNELIMKGIREN